MIAALHCFFRAAVRLELLSRGVSVGKECRNGPQKVCSWDSQNMFARWGTKSWFRPEELASWL